MRLAISLLSLIALLSLGVLGAPGCSFTTGSKFEECSNDTECGPTGACVRQYCLALPEACTRLEGSFDGGDRIPLATLVPLLADGGANDREVIRLEAMRLALWEANSNGGLNHRSYGLFACNVLPDDENGVRSLTKWLITNLEVPAIFSSGSTRTRWTADNDLRTDAGTFIMSANATAASLIALHTSIGNVWRVAPPDTQQARVVRALVLEADAGKTVSILYEKTDYGDGFKVELLDELQQAGLGLKLVDYQPPLDGPKADAVIGKLDGGHLGSTVVIGFPADVAALATAAAKVPLLMPSSGHRWFLSDAAKDPTIATKPALEGALGTAPAQGSGGAFTSFTQSFQNRYSIDPSLYSFTAHSYDAMWLTLLATTWATHGGPITGRRMGDAMGNLATSSSPKATPLLAPSWAELSRSLKTGTPVDVEGSSGPLDFDVSAGAPSSKYEVWIVSGGVIGSLGTRTPN